MHEMLRLEYADVLETSDWSMHLLALYGGGGGGWGGEDKILENRNSYNRPRSWHLCALGPNEMSPESLRTPRGLREPSQYAEKREPLGLQIIKLQSDRALHSNRAQL